MLSFLAFTFYHMLTIIRYIEIYFMIALLDCVGKRISYNGGSIPYILP